LSSWLIPIRNSVYAPAGVELSRNAAGWHSGSFWEASMTLRHF